MTTGAKSAPRAWLTGGDVDGFFGLAVDNLVQLLLVDGLCRFVLGFPPDLLYGRVLPGVAVSLAVGNLFYAHQARRLALKEGRSDVCALPYGINTVSLFAFVFLVMLPAKLAAEAAGAADPARAAFQAGLFACLGSGLIELAGAPLAERLRKLTPRAALLATLSGIALTFISIGFLLRTFATPLVGMATLGIVLLVYFGRVRFGGGIPGGLVAVLVGWLLCWITGLAPTAAAPPEGQWGLRLPELAVMDLWAGASSVEAGSFVAVIVPMGLFNLVGSLQNIESAEAAGDSFPTAPSLAVNGLGTLVAALLGSCFPTTIYIGHPGWKEMGARAGYSLLNAAFFLMVLCSGALGWVAWVLPVEAGMAIVLWIGIVITAQAFSSTPRSHAPAVVVGLLPGVAAWGALMAKAGLRAAGVGSAEGPALGPEFEAGFAASDIAITGAFALEQGFLLSAVVLAASTVCLIERRPRGAAVWCVMGALLSATGLMHSFRYTPADTVLSLSPSLPHVAGYAVMALLFFVAPWVTRPNEPDTP